MKICPLITQVSILEEPSDVILLGEADDTDLHNEGIGENDGDENTEGNESGDIFMNPDSETSSDEDSDGDSDAESEEDGGENETGSTGESHNGDQDYEAPAKPVRFVARSTRGEVRCLGDQCRFHDNERGECGIEILLRSGSNGDDGRAEEAREAEERLDERLESIRGNLEKSWDFQQRSTGDILGMFRELEEKSTESAGMLKESFEKSFGEIKELISSVNEDNKLIVDSLSDTLAERSEDLDNRLDESISKIEIDMEENRRLTREVSENNSEIMQVVENQKKTLEEEECRRKADEAKKLNNAGVMSYHNGQYEKALDLFKKAIEIDGEFTEGYNNLGLTYTEMNEENKATEAFKKAIELNPDLAATYNNLGYVFYRLGSYTEAIEMYNEAIGRSGDNSSAYTNLGNAYYKLDRVEDAIDAWQKALDIDPSNEKAKRNLKRFHAESK